ncbi:MAG TPA: class I SAM-dependent methyltransferase [Thermoplasmata archaeon]|nr:class I SAM-dependent methyltransferase [Thermoplasmata archaeon]
MVPRRPPRPEWKRWLASWDRQQESFTPDREARFSLILDVLESELPPRFTALDLGSGPGSLAVRVVRRFPRARVVAVDFDPVALQIGQGALRSWADRIDWVDADLNRSEWTAALPAPRFDAALSTTALHWLGRATLTRLYRDLYRRMKPGGILLNGDYFPGPASPGGLRALSRRVHAIRQSGPRRTGGWDSWREWWRSVEKEPRLAEAMQARRRRFPHFHPSTNALPVAWHERAIRRAGFRDVGVVWQEFEDRLLFARRDGV